MQDEKIYKLHIAGNKHALDILKDNYQDRLTQYLCCYIDDNLKIKDIIDYIFYLISIFNYYKLKKNFCAYIYKMARENSLRYIKKMH